MILSDYRGRIIEKMKINFDKNIINKYIEGSTICDKTFSDRSNVLYIEDKGIYIKIAESDSLKSEFENTVFFNKLGVAGEVIDYLNDKSNDYLIVKEVKGDNGISQVHKNNPKKLASSFGSHLRMIHSLKYDICPGINRTKNLFYECNKKVREDKIDMASFHKKYGFTPNQGILMLESLKSSCVDDVFIHGDYYLPNIIMNDFEFSGIVDMDLSGIGDRHIDIMSGLKSLEINFKTKEYDDIFLDAYGRDLIDKDRLAFAKLLLILN